MSISEGGDAKRLKLTARMAPRGVLCTATWLRIRNEQGQSVIGWVPLLCALLSHTLALAALAAVALLGILSPWLAAVCVIPAATVVAVAYRGLENLVHGASHGDVCGWSPTLNDLLANLLFAAAVGQDVNLFRAIHLAQHHSAFGGTQDPCAMRMRDRDDVSHGALPGVAQTLRRAWREALQFWRTAGGSPLVLGRAVLWQAIAVLAPLVLMVGLHSALLGYAVVMPLALLVLLPIVRALAEAGEHDYADGPADSILERTFDNTGVLNGLLHPYGDAFHVLHHLAPGVPQHRLARLTSAIMSADPIFAAFVRRRRGVLSPPEPYNNPARKPVHRPAAKPIAKFHNLTPLA